MSRTAKTTFTFLVVANLLLCALVGRLSWSRFASPSPAETEDCGNYNEAIQVAQESALTFLLNSEADHVAIDPDVTASLFKRTGIWTIKGFATSGDTHKFRWVVILAYHAGGAASDRWELVTVTARPLEKNPGTLSQESSRSLEGDLLPGESDEVHESATMAAVAALGIATRIGP
jgi:hypothetical protein